MTADVSSPAHRPTAREVLANLEFRAFLAANSLFHLCSSSLTVMLAFHIYSLRNNPLDIAALGFVQVIPALTVAFHAGDVADRRPRRFLVVLTIAMLAGLALVISIVSAAGAATVWLLLAAGFLSATIRAYENPANVGLEAQVIPVEHILRALPMVSTAARVSDMTGPVLMGFVWAWGGPAATYALMAAILAASALVMWSRIAPKITPEAPSKLPPLRRIREGFSFVWGNQILLGSMVLDLFAVFFGGAAALLPIFATEILDAGPEGFGLLRSSIAAGTLCAALISIRYMPAVSAGLALHFIVVGFGLSMIVFALSGNFWLSMAMLFLAGVCDGFSMVIRHAILRLASPEHMRGRIAAVRMVFVASSNELGAVQSGTMASLIGPVRAVVAGGLLTIVVAGVVAHRMPLLRSLNLLEYGSNVPRRTPEHA
jgi:MFS family permease